MQFIILGMHRSGTSVFSRLLNLMGIYFGPEGMITGANSENPKGFWERKDIRIVNDKILHSNDFDWNQIADFDIRKLSKDSVDCYQGEISNIILKMDTNRPWFLKEPRICLLFEMWKSFLEIPVCLHVIRNPLEVALSLKNRNAIPVLTGIALWEKYNIAAFNSSRNIPRIVVSYNDVLNDPVSYIEKLCAKLSNLGAYGIRIPSQDEITSFIDNSFYRQRDQNEHCLEYLNNDQKLLYEAVLNDSILMENKIYQLSRGSKEELKRYESDISYTHKLSINKQELVKCQKVLESDKQELVKCQKVLESENKELRGLIDIQEQELLRYRELRESASQELNDKNQELHKCQTKQQNKKNEYEKKQNQLMDIIELLFDDYRRLFNSKFWKLQTFMINSVYRLSFRKIPPTVKDHINVLKERYGKFLG